MIVFDNIIFSLQRSGGISVVWYETLKRVLRDRRTERLFIEYGGAAENIFRGELEIPQGELAVKKKGWPFGIVRYLNPRLRSIRRPFVFHSSYYRTTGNRAAVNITTVHDFTYERYVSGIRRAIHCRQKYAAIRRSDIIVCVSENTRKDLLKYLPEAAGKAIKVIYNGVSDDYRPIADTGTPPFPKGSYLLFVGARGGYKRFGFAVETASACGYRLAIAGGGGLSAAEDELLRSKLGEGGYVHVGSVSNAGLNMLYNNAFCLIYPSEYEGFGIPVLEAQKAGCPVVAYNGSSIPEIIGGGLLFDSFDTDEAAAKIDSLKDPLRRKEIIDSGIANARRFSWDKTYAELSDVYREALAMAKNNEEQQ